VLRAVGLRLSPYGVTDFFSNPQLTLHDAAGEVLVTIDDWSDVPGSDALSEVMRTVGAFSLAVGSNDAALAREFRHGVYTVTVTGGGFGRRAN